MSAGGVGGVGGMGAMGAGMAMGAAGVGGVSGDLGMGGLNGPLGNTNVAALGGMSSSRMDQLLQLLNGFSSAEILIALMMSAGSAHRRRHCSDDSGLSFLLGLSMAAQLGQSLQQMLPQAAGGVASAAGATGQQLNATA